MCHRETLQPRILPPENLSTPGFGLGRTSLTAADLEAEALAVRVKVHWAIWLRSGLLTQIWYLDARFWCQKRTHFLKLFLMVWSWEAWGLARVGFGQVLTKVLHVLPGRRKLKSSEKAPLGARAPKILLFLHCMLVQLEILRVVTTRETFGNGAPGRRTGLLAKDWIGIP